MKVEDNVLARVYSFDLQFKGGKRTIFYRKLFGFKSKSTREDKEGRKKVYENFYPGVLTPIPHLRLGKSVIAIPKTARKKLDSFFSDSRWGTIDLYSFDGILPPEDRMRAMEETQERIMITRERSLRSELDSLLTVQSQDRLGSEDVQRIRRVLENSEKLMEHDWTDGLMFSERLKEEIRPLKDYVR